LNDLLPHLFERTIPFSPIATREIEIAVTLLHRSDGRAEYISLIGMLQSGVPSVEHGGAYWLISHDKQSCRLPRKDGGA